MRSMADGKVDCSGTDCDLVKGGRAPLFVNNPAVEVDEEKWGTSNGLVVWSM